MKFTVFTPTFNRCHLLKRLYEYLKSEEYNDLEWLIIDDGSTDETEKYIESLNNEKFTIRYYKQKNSGKYVAFNKAIDEAEGKYFICIDSDDLYVRGAFVELEKLTQELQADDAGLCYLSATPDGKIIGSTFPQNITRSNLIDLYYKYGVTGDKGILHKTNVLKKYRFPVFPGEKFATETLLYGQIPNLYKLVNKVVEIKYYQQDGLTAKYREVLRKNPQSSLKNYQLIDKYTLQPKMAIRNTIRYLSFVYYTGTSWKNNVSQCRHKLLYVILSPIGYCVHVHYLIEDKL